MSNAARLNSESVIPLNPQNGTRFEDGLHCLGLALWKIDLRSGQVEWPQGSEATFKKVMRLDVSHFQEGRFAFAQIAHSDDKDRLIATLTEGLSRSISTRFRLIDPETQEERFIKIQMTPANVAHEGSLPTCIWCLAEDQTRETRVREQQKRDFTRRILSSLTQEDLDQSARTEMLTSDIETATILKWKPQFESAQIKWIGPEMAPQGPPSTISVSPQLVALMIDALMQNAIEALFEKSDESSPRWVRFESFDDSQFVYFAVNDSGVGIDLPQRSRIFEPFTSSKSNEHTGLGLTLAREIAALHGGSLKLDHFSPTTRFIVQIPKQTQAADSV